jgi:hypothetical protein
VGKGEGQGGAGSGGLEVRAVVAGKERLGEVLGTLSYKHP